ncbi:MAG: hypothetical protein KJ971_07410 [Firmicutes bacterium]|nr:hypothetical protein [Bacillota bacterium]
MGNKGKQKKEVIREEKSSKKETRLLEKVGALLIHNNEERDITEKNKKICIAYFAIFSVLIFFFLSGILWIIFNKFINFELGVFLALFLIDAILLLIKATSIKRSTKNFKFDIWDIIAIINGAIAILSILIGLGKYF